MSSPVNSAFSFLRMPLSVANLLSERVSAARFQRKRCGMTRASLLVPAERAQRIAAIIVGIGMLSIEGDGSIVTRQSFIPSLQSAKNIAAVEVGGTAVTGGKGTILGTLLGLILLGIIGPALTFLGISAYWERAIQGVIILAAVAIDAVRARPGRYAGSHAGSPARSRV